MPTFDTLVDDFEDGTLDPTRWSGSYGDPDEVGGRARIPCTTGFAGLKSGSIYTLTGSAVAARLFPPAQGGATTAAASVLILTSVGGTDAGFIVDTAQNAVGCYLREGYADGAAVFLTYDPVAHAWLRIRENAGSLFWETSPDGSSWTNQRTAATPAWAANTDLAFLIEGHRDAGTNDFVEVAAVNAPSTATGTATLTATSSASAAGTLRAVASAQLEASGDAEAVGVRRTLGASTGSASSAVAAAGTRIVLGAATFDGAATATTVGIGILHGTAGLEAAGAATAVGALRARGASTLTADAALTAAGIRRVPAAAAGVATGGATAAGTRTVRGAVTCTATGRAMVIQGIVDYGITVGAPYTMWEVGTSWL